MVPALAEEAEGAPKAPWPARLGGAEFATTPRCVDTSSRPPGWFWNLGKSSARWGASRAASFDSVAAAAAGSTLQSSHVSSHSFFR